MATKPAAPFVFGRVADKANFVDRDAERQRLADNFRSLTNTAIISPRRWGKSSLVRRVADDLADDKSLRLCLIDMYDVRSEADFYSHLADGVMRATMTKWDEWVEATHRFLTQLRPTVSISPGPMQSVSFDVDWQQAALNPDEVLDLAQNIAADKRIKLVICVDEFQCIAGFPDAVAFQRKLRSHWQNHSRVCYCLYGSRRHMLVDIFSNPDLPFYRFGDVLVLGKIDNAIWGDFISRRFTETGKTCTSELGRRIAALVDNHSYYVQQLAQQTWFRTTSIATDAIADAALADLTSQLSLVFTTITDSLTSRQLGFLRAAIDGEPAPSSQRALRTYGLGTSANVTRIKEALVNREIIDVNGTATEILDPLFKNWLATTYFARRPGVA